jgi:alkanesulfonate monooxygenase SsuD/methylene tetrahydromethanopterin reductase-like flavin-dependent oxidoreductase (luciferase family)
MTYVSIHSDRDRARQAVKFGILGAVAGSHPTYDFLRANGLEIPPALYQYLETGARDKKKIVQLIPDSFVGKLAIAGTVEDCAGQLEALLATGIQHPLLAPCPVVVGGEVAILKTLTKHILPGMRS